MTSISTGMVGRSPKAAEVDLLATGVSVRFGGQEVLRSISLQLRAGEVGLLRGANGSGKTTFLNVLSGFLRPETGTLTIRRDGEIIDVTRASADKLARLGVARLWQDIRLFAEMTVLDNVMVASPQALGLHPIAALVAWRRVRQQEQQFREAALAWLRLVGMEDRRDSSADMLSLGQSKRVAMARLLQSGARVLLLDEPLAGLDRGSAIRLVADLARVAGETGCSMLIVEHEHEAIAPICSVQYVLADGLLQRVTRPRT